NIMFLDDSVSDFFSASWYPRAINYDKGAWRKRDFLTNNYEVNFVLPENEKIITSGIELNTEILKARGLKKVSYKINNARSFAVAISPDLAPEIEESKEGVTVKAYYKTNKHNKWSRTILDLSKDILSFYHQKFGFYPYK